MGQQTVKKKGKASSPRISWRGFFFLRRTCKYKITSTIYQRQRSEILSKLYIYIIAAYINLSIRMPTVMQFESLIESLSSLDIDSSDTDTEKQKKIAECFGDLLPYKIQSKYGLRVVKDKPAEDVFGKYKGWSRKVCLEECKRRGIERGLSAAKLTTIIQRMLLFDSGQLRGFGKYSDINIFQLKAKCAERDMRDYHNLKKALLIEKLIHWDNTNAEDPTPEKSDSESDSDSDSSASHPKKKMMLVVD